MFILLPVGMNYQTQRAPVVTFTLMGMNILVYLVSLGFLLGQGSDSAIWMHQHLWLIPADSTWYTYLTSMFVHAGFFHLLGNMLYLFLFGCCVEDMIGRWRFLGRAWADWPRQTVPAKAGATQARTDTSPYPRRGSGRCPNPH